MIKYILKLIKKQRLLKKYKKEDFDYEKLLFILNNLGHKEARRSYEHQFYCELKCYNRLKKL